jgi:hypothetical protein
MPLKSEIHEPAASFGPKAGNDELYASAIFDIPKIIIILIYFGNFRLTGYY